MIISKASKILAAIVVAACFLLPFVAHAQVTSGAVGRIGSVGSWTPTVTTSSTVGTPAYTTQVGSYVVMGSYVFAQFDLVLSGWTGSPSGNVSIASLPFTSTATASDNGGCVITQYTVTGLAASNWGITGVIAPSSTTALLQQHANAATAAITAAQAGATPTLIGFCTYHK